MTSAIELARELIAAGVPVVVCPPRQGWKPGDTRLDIVPPSGWSIISAAECDVSGFRPGVDTLAMVGGHGVDVVDCDTKAPGFGTLENMPPFRRFGRTGTPSGGTHDYVRSTGIAKISPLTTSAGHVGDYVGGTPEGGGRLLAFLPGSTRPKYPGLTYTVIEPLRLAELLEHDPDDDLMAVLLACGGNRAGLPGKPSASLTATRGFLAEHSTAPERRCSYGKAALAGMLTAASATTPGDVKAGRHGWAVASATRCVELVRAGCAWSADLDLIETTLHSIKPEGGSDWGGIMAWAVNNATGTVGCGMHNPAPKVDTSDAPFGAIEHVPDGYGETLDGAQLLDQVEAMLARFVAFPSEEARIAVTLWVAHTHALTAFECTPRLAFLSPEPGSGKTRAMEILELLVLRPLLTVNVTPAYLFRKVADQQGPPTILYDEIDTVFGPKAKDNEDIRGMLNAGYRRGATAGRCVIKGKTVEVEELPAFAAVALAGLDDLPDTIMSRSIVIRMRRRAPNERIESYRRRVHQTEGHELRDDLAAWVSAVWANLQDAWPDLPKGIEDRNADVWEPLLAVADAAGGHWPVRARATAVTLVSAAQTSAGGFGMQLLADLRAVFGSEPAMTTEAIIEALCALDESPWADIRGKALDARSLSRRLSKYGIKPKVIRIGDKTPRGYDRADLHDSWVRYLPDPTVALVADVAQAPAKEGADVALPKAISMKSDPTHPGVQSPAATPAPLLPQASATSATPQHIVTDCEACGGPLAAVLIADDIHQHIGCAA